MSRLPGGRAGQRKTENRTGSPAYREHDGEATVRESRLTADVGTSAAARVFPAASPNANRELCSQLTAASVRTSDADEGRVGRISTWSAASVKSEGSSSGSRSGPNRRRTSPRKATTAKAEDPDAPSAPPSGAAEVPPEPASEEDREAWPRRGDNEWLVRRAREAVGGAPGRVRRAALSAIEAALPSLGDPEDPKPREWLTWLAELPWNSETAPNLDVTEAGQILDRLHGGHPDVKEAMLDRIASAAHVASSGGTARIGPILLVGPPGTGKTTLARAIAQALKMPSESVSAPAAAEDPVYLQGCDRQYRGSGPGMVIRAFRAAGSSRLLLLLDEIDKVVGSRSWGASPTAWLLELLGSDSWTDRYLGFDYPTGAMVVICTANEINHIAPPVLDRLDVVHVPGLSPSERAAVARTHLWPRLLEEYCLDEEQVPILDEALALAAADHLGTSDRGLRLVETRLRRCLYRAIRVGSRCGWPVIISPEFVREALQDRIQPSRRVAGFALIDHPVEGGSLQSPGPMP